MKDYKNNKFIWPPEIPELGSVVKNYIDGGGSLSISDNSSIYHELETKLCNIFNRKHCLLLSSGTIGLYSVFYSLNLKESDEVISTVYSYHATTAPLLHNKAKIVYCDVEPDTGNIDTVKLAGLINERTKAIVTNDMWGHPVKKDAIVKLCKKNGIKYIEDCSHAHFSEYKNKFCGTFGDAAVFSLQGNKLLTGGEGGFILTDSQEIFEKCVLLGHNLKRPYNDVKNPYYSEILRTGLGLKFRIHPLSAVIVNYLLDNYCFEWVKSRKNTLEYFSNRLKEIEYINPPIIKNYVTSMGAFYGYKPTVDFKSLSIKRESFLDLCIKEGLDIDEPGSKPFYHYDLFVNPQKYLNYSHKTNINDPFKNAEKYYQSIISVPTFTFEEDKYTIDIYVEKLKSIILKITKGKKHEINKDF